MYSKKLISITTAALASFAFAACGGDESDDGPRTFSEDGFPFTFEYPGDWAQSEDVSVDQQVGLAPDQTLAIGPSTDTGLILQRYTLPTEIDEKTLDQALTEFDSLFQQIDPEASGATDEVAGYPALTYDVVSLTQPEGGESSYTILFDGDQEFLLNCQTTEDDRDAINADCDAAVESIEPTE